jgi:HD-like signal output (HDOD) protein
MADVVQRSASSHRPMSEVERERLGTTHAEVGAYLLGLWGLPLPVVEAVAYHHAIPAARRSELRLAVLIHSADVLLEQAIASRSGAAAEELDLAALDAHGFTDHLQGWRELAAAEAQAAPSV